jgi:hypothetical protein
VCAASKQASLFYKQNKYFEIKKKQNRSNNYAFFLCIFELRSTTEQMPAPVFRKMSGPSSSDVPEDPGHEYYRRICFVCQEEAKPNQVNPDALLTITPNVCLAHQRVLLYR